MEMSEKAKEARRAYLRDYRRRNPEKAKEAKARYWERKAAKLQTEEKEGAEEHDGNHGEN